MSLILNPAGYARYAALALLLAAGCESTPDKGAPPPAPRPPAASASAASPPRSAAPATSQSADGPPPLSNAELAGTWLGTYDAKKGEVLLPPSVKDKTHASDDGKVMTGPGKVEIVISRSGEVKGTASGALGDATLTGQLGDDGKLGVSWWPDDPRSPNAMSGTLIGLVKDSVIHAKIRAAGPNATLARESPIDLKKK
jgi:hypothetical protein